MKIYSGAQAERTLEANEEERLPSTAVMQRLSTVRKWGGVSDSDERVFST